VAVISVNERNRWGFPHPAVVERWRAAGARVLRTDQDGGITVSVDGHGRVAVEGTRQGVSSQQAGRRE
jgi:competence protein ComEC